MSQPTNLIPFPTEPTQARKEKRLLDDLLQRWHRASPTGKEMIYLAAATLSEQEQRHR